MNQYSEWDYEKEDRYNVVADIQNDDKNRYSLICNNFTEDKNITSFQKQKQEMKVALSGPLCCDYEIVSVDETIIRLNRPENECWNLNTCVVRPTTEIIYQGILNKTPKEQIPHHFTITFVPRDQPYQEYKDNQTAVTLYEKEMKFSNQYGRDCSMDTRLIASTITKIGGRAIVLAVDLKDIQKLHSEMKFVWNKKYESSISKILRL
jgi:hypothetical protein